MLLKGEVGEVEGFDHQKFGFIYGFIKIWYLVPRLLGCVGWGGFGKFRVNIRESFRATGNIIQKKRKTVIFTAFSVSDRFQEVEF